VNLIFGEDQKEQTLNSVSSFSSRTVTLQAGTNTNYTCSYANGYYSVLNITDSKSFTIKGGILKYGNTSLSTPINYHFMIVNGTGGPSLYFSGVQIEFVSTMNSIVLILGGKVTLEDVKINNQLDTTWVSPLVLSHSGTSSVTVDLHSCTITNSNYESANPSYARSAIVYFFNETTTTQSVTLNISFYFCYNNTFTLSSVCAGGVSLFHSYNTSSSMWIFLIKKEKEKRKFKKRIKIWGKKKKKKEKTVMYFFLIFFLMNKYFF
jgi:hypothetical protein